ncbi:MAG TPA: hypothetical protein VL371_07105 [Gemmataceae bacterium]|nr:hypothetical protein [Gemmataceae bacterium]
MTRHPACQSFWGEPAIAGHPHRYGFGVNPGTGPGRFAGMFRTAHRSEPAGAFVYHQDPQQEHSSTQTFGGGSLSMPDAATRIRRLFGTPGSADVDTADLLDQAATAHAGLVARANGRADPVIERSLVPLREFLVGPARAADKRRLLCHPLLIEGLHALAPFCGDLRRWHDSVTAAAPDARVTDNDVPVEATKAALGNVALVARLREQRSWSGEHELCTDVLGRIGFPFCDWTLTLNTDRHEFLANEAVTLTLGHDEATWALASAADTPFLVVSRADCLRMILGNDDTLERERLIFPNAVVRPRLQFANRLGRSPIRYDPVGFRDHPDHAGMTGGVVRSLLLAIRRNSPAVYRELCAFTHTIRGFEFPRSQSGVVDSFSDPTVPGVIGISIPYTPQDELCLDLYCFTWFGHEMGHTKDYLCDSILYEQGEKLVCNAAERTDPIPRYGRSLSMRTVFQVPYVHLYEFALFMDFWQAGFRGLPWDVGDAASLGDDLAAEIAEAFALIDEWTRLTPLGEVALAHFRDLFVAAQKRWQNIRGRVMPL